MRRQRRCQVDVFVHVDVGPEFVSRTLSSSSGKKTSLKGKGRYVKILDKKFPENKWTVEWTDQIIKQGA